jgi:hypothetical protein
MKILLLAGIISLGSAAVASAAFGGFTSSDVAGTITDPPETGTMTWHSHNSVHVQRLTQGTGLLRANTVDCTRG